jgi:hypothetical protein
VASLFRFVAVLLGVALLVGAGVVHGLWTDRWEPSLELERSVQRLAELPADIGSWKGEAYEQDAEALTQTGAVAHYSRTFTDPTSGERVLVVLLAGKPGRMSVHRPENCYRASGYELAGEPIRCTVRPSGTAAAEFWTGVFVREEATGPTHTRIYWTWYDGEHWVAPDSPRWRFARCRVLYKLYVIRNVAAATPPETGPCVRLLGELLPALERRLAAE